MESAEQDYGYAIALLHLPGYSRSFVVQIVLLLSLKSSIYALCPFYVKLIFDSPLVVNLNQNQMMHTLHIEKQEYTISLIGTLDAMSSPELDSLLRIAINSAPKTIIINCKYLDYISSAGLGVFISYLEEIKEKKINFKIMKMSRKIWLVFELLGLNNLIDIVPEDVNHYLFR